MPRDPNDIDDAEKTGAPAKISKQTPEEEAEAERKRKEAEVAAAAVAAAEAAKTGDEEKTEKNEALDAINDIAVLATNLRDISKDRAVAKNEEKGDAKLDRTAVVKAAYADPCEHLSEDEFLALEKAVNAIAPFLPTPYPTPGRKPVDPRLLGKDKDKDKEKGEGDFTDPDGTNKGHLSKKEAEAVLSLVNKTVPKILETLSALTEKVS